MKDLLYKNSRKYQPMELVLKTQFGVNRSVPKMHFFPFLNTEKYYEREPYRFIKVGRFFIEIDRTAYRTAF
jgi:hypothetical protein